MIVKHLIVIVSYTACFYFWYRVGIRHREKKQADANVEETKRILNNKIKINGYKK